VFTGYLVMCHPSALLLKRFLFPAVSCILDAVRAYRPMRKVGINRENIDSYFNYDDDDDSSPVITKRGIGFLL
jgi:hypothetical protein